MTWPPGGLLGHIMGQTIATNGLLLTGPWPRVWGLAANLDQSCEILLRVLVGSGRRAQGVKMLLFWVKHYIEVGRVIQAAYQPHYTPG